MIVELARVGVPTKINFGASAKCHISHVVSIGAEASAAGQPWTEATMHQAMAVLSDELAPISDLRAGAAYRKLVARNLLVRLHAAMTDPVVDPKDAKHPVKVATHTKDR